MTIGEFKGWKPETFYGFIKGAAGEKDIFILKKSVDEPEALGAGSSLEFDIETTAKGIQAANVRVINRMPPQVIAAPIVVRDGIEMQGFVKFWNDRNNTGYVSVNGAAYGSDVFVSGAKVKDTGGYCLQAGDELTFEKTIIDGRPSAENAKLVGWRKTGNEFSDQVQLKKVSWKSDLDEMAEDDKWEFSAETGVIDRPILDSYIRHTFLRLLETEGLRFEDSYMSFNTGLVTENQESIFGLLTKSTGQAFRPWILQGFVKSSDRVFFHHFGGGPPPLAEYFVDQGDLLYDRKLKLTLDLEHILENLDRFPDNLKSDAHTARSLLVSAQSMTEQRVYRNYKTAIPQFFRDKGIDGQLQLLLPLCLNKPGVADLALTVAKNKKKDAYLGSTVLTLDMAYKNARLLARPDTEWLKP